MMKLAGFVLGACLVGGACAGAARGAESAPAAAATTDAAHLEVMGLVDQLNAVRGKARELLGGKVSADPYLAALGEAQRGILGALGRRGVKARLVARYDYGGLPVPRILRGGSRESLEDAVISATGNVEIGRGRIADAILVEPVESGAFVNSFARVLKERYGVATVIEAG